MDAQYILIIEDDANWQTIFSEIVEDAGFRPEIVSTLPEAQTALAARPYALAIVDLSLSEQNHADRSGVRVLRDLDRLPGALPAIVVTGYATVDLAIETLVELNAVHFFRKDDFDRAKFAAVVEKEALRPQASPAFSEDGPELLQALSDREREVLALLIEGRTNKQIADALTITVNTVKKHLQSIFTKFNVDSRTAAVAKALGRNATRR